LNFNNLNINKEYVIKLSSLEDIIDIIMILNDYDIYWLGPILSPFKKFTKKEQIEKIKTWNFVDPSYIEVYFVNDAENNSSYWAYNFINQNYLKTELIELSAIQLVRNEKIKKLSKQQ